jgi:hypothetical protein
MALMAMSVEDREGERMVSTIKDVFPSWGDQVASGNGNGVLVSMWYVDLPFSYLTDQFRRKYDYLRSHRETTSSTLRASVINTLSVSRRHYSSA